MMKARFIIFLSWMFVAFTANAQMNYRDYIRKGNKEYNDSSFVKAEVLYRKALQQQPNSPHALYNLGNAMLMQQKPKDAMQQYEKALKYIQAPLKKADAYHNMGVILQSQKQFKEAIECYKNALRIRPNDDETRYNLVLCQKQLKDQKNNPDQNQNKDNQGKQNQDQKQNKDKQNQNKQNQDQQQNKNQNKDQNKQNQQSQPKEPQMSKDNAEQILKAAMQDEKSVQDKVKRAQMKSQRHKCEKDW